MNSFQNCDADIDEVVQFGNDLLSEKLIGDPNRPKILEDIKAVRRKWAAIKQEIKARRRRYVFALSNILSHQT